VLEFNKRLESLPIEYINKKTLELTIEPSLESSKNQDLDFDFTWDATEIDKNQITI